MIDIEIWVALADDRTIADKTIVGDGTGDDDELFIWRAENGVLTFANEVMRLVFGEWGIVLNPRANLILDVRRSLYC